ncbi:hypothetical protein [Gulosibacter sp. 10]|uniref:hypothetical protein n=1 Tax=Gulosibacter sp. 10 TaxID=1255570 RepID=UPI00097F1443|nr:hypothetical protein [Gulosibacter sp. 10]SJM50793.1 hypothetical protein FM112_01610 [Gulosibacter sp. 10]
MSNHLAELRELAQFERDSMIERRVREGADPAEVYAELPETEELLVLMLRDDELEARGQMAEYTLARMAQQTRQPNAETLGRLADGIDAGLYRGIARRYPQLSRTVWRMLGDVEPVGSLEEPSFRSLG